MYRKKADFLQDWKIASKGTTRVLEALSDDTLGQAIAEGHNTLGWLGWHLATAPAFFASQVGLKLKSVDASQPVPAHASEIVEGYKTVAEELKNEVEANLTDEMFLEEMDSFGKLVARGAMLRTLIDHQTHHRGQMTVLLRQAGLKVPGVMGPTKEDQE
ncbi:DinB family protein [Ornithinibacillus contaminans]|uniref:DinB family protein n=1 Tax=Ornithinibacillus contaminans TaxID=694055 RepID=UPI00064DD8FC|nr:DinB family protein [Ornithinibacillus contaminans]